MTELRVNIPDDTDIIAVMDGYCQATGKSRTDIVIEVLGTWAAQKKHEAILICRVAGINPTASETHRRASDDP
ncbi:MAG: hypothetical protein ACXWT4_06160 [Methylobacter sp.]